MIPKTNKEFSRLAGSGLPRNPGKLHNDPAKYQSGVQRPTAARGQEAQAQQSAEQAAAKDAALRSAGLVGAGAGLLSKAVSSVSPKRSDRFTNEDWANLQRTVWKKTHEKQLEQVKNRLEARGALIDVPTRATAAASRQLQEQLMEHEQRATPAAVNAIGGSELLKRLRADFFLDWSKKTTDQQREALEHSGLTRQEWWKLLNLDEHYLETLSDIRNIREHRGAYGLSPKEADEVYGRLIDLASSRAFASGREAPFASSGARNTFLEMLRNDEAALFESIGYVRGSAPLARGGTQTAYGRIDGPGAAHIRQGDGIGKTHPAWYDKNDAAAEPPAPQTFGNVLKTLFLSLLFPYGCAPAPDTPEPSATPGSTPQTVILDLLPTPTNAPATPTPEPTPEPTPSPMPTVLWETYLSVIDGLTHREQPIPYVYGGKDPKKDGGLDCSGFVQYVINQCNIPLRQAFGSDMPNKQPSVNSRKMYTLFGGEATDAKGVPYGETKWTSGSDTDLDPGVLEAGDLLLLSPEKVSEEKHIARQIRHVVFFVGYDSNGNMLISEASSYRGRVLTQPIVLNAEGKRMDTKQYVCAVVRPNYNYGIDD